MHYFITQMYEQAFIYDIKIGAPHIVDFLIISNLCQTPIMVLQNNNLSYLKIKYSRLLVIHGMIRMAFYRKDV